MKITVEVDARVMEEALKATGARSREEVANTALKRMAEKRWNKSLFRRLSPHFLTPSDLEDALYPDYDPRKPNLGLSLSPDVPSNAQNDNQAAARG